MYECHVTLPEMNVHGKAFCNGLAQELGWKTSFIIGDPLLGVNGFFYLTAHNRDSHRLYGKMKELLGRLEREGLEVLREKIEHIVHDTKTNIQLEGVLNAQEQKAATESP